MNDIATAATSLVLERTLPHPQEKVWRALTQQPLLEEWLMQNNFEPRLGHRFKLRWENNGMRGVIDSEVLKLEPPRELAYRWDSMGVETIVTFTLTPTAEGTRLRMEQAGFREGQEYNRKGAEYGWNGFLDKLEPVVARLS